MNEMNEYEKAAKLAKALDRLAERFTKKQGEADAAYGVARRELILGAGKKAAMLLVSGEKLDEQDIEIVAAHAKNKGLSSW